MFHGFYPTSDDYVAQNTSIYFDTSQAAPGYNDALKFRGFNENIQFTSTPLKRRNHNRKFYMIQFTIKCQSENQNQ